MKIKKCNMKQLLCFVIPGEAADNEGTGSQAWYGWYVWTLSLFDTRA